MFDKRAIVSALVAKLRGELELLEQAAAAAREGATHEEAKPENEYDTRALEQSYLAGAQNARVEALRSTLSALTSLSPRAFTSEDAIAAGACVRIDDGTQERRYFLCELGGGTKLQVGDEQWFVLTPSSPLGKLLLRKRVGDVVEHVIRGEDIELEILEVT